jgi:ribonuclease P protein component
MLPREHRLRRSGDFARVRQQGRAFSHPWLVVATAPNGEAVTRVGFTVSKRVGKAHVRNRVKRVLRAIVRRYLPALTPGYDVVVISRPIIAAQPFAAVEDVLRRQLQFARLLARTNNQVAHNE